MIKQLFFSGLIVLLYGHGTLSAHCQMPCGIYHDEMVFDQIDQYVETMVKGMSVLIDSPFNTVHQRNEFVRWVMQKDKSSDEIAQLILTFFLQQKIKPDEQDTAKRVLSAHKMLFYLVQIKQNVDFDVVKEFYDEWEKFKLMFHIEGYKCKVEQYKLKRLAERRKEMEKKWQEDHDHSHDHDHDHHHDDDHSHSHF